MDSRSIFNTTHPPADSNPTSVGLKPLDSRSIFNTTHPPADSNPTSVGLNPMDSCAYLINTTPKYFYLIPLHLTLLKRYAKSMKWPVYLATEVPEHPIIQDCISKYNLQVIPLTPEQESFLDSRAVGCQKLPPEIQYIFPIQEDFLLEGRPMWQVFEHAFSLFEKDDSIHSFRMMPCPGPRGSKKYRQTEWHELQFGLDDYIFTYQATLWRRSTYQEYMDRLCSYMEECKFSQSEKNKCAIEQNIAEVEFGQTILQDIGGIHLAWPREGQQPNAVYLSPWPYRPTAVIRGRLMDWAVDLASREKITLFNEPSLR